MKRTYTKRGMRGFSLTEVLIVATVGLCVAATAIPKVVTTVANLELRSGVRSAAGILQQGRTTAIKNNKRYKVRYVNATGGGRIYVDLNNNYLVDATDPQAQLGTTVLASMTPTGIPALADTDLGFSPSFTTSVGFNSTGQPCNIWNTCAVGMVVYFTDTRTVGNPGWAAVAISPSGRVSTWVWTGSAWAN